MQRISRALIVSVLATLTACATQQSERPEAPEPSMTIRGSLAFREGVTPPPGSVVTVTLADFADDTTAPVAILSMEIEDSRVLLPFELHAPVSKLALDRQYVVRAAVMPQRNAARWMTDVAQIIDTTREEVDIGVLLMTQSREATRDPDLD